MQGGTSSDFWNLCISYEVFALLWENHTNYPLLKTPEHTHDFAGPLMFEKFTLT
jgi:hypothetical protein